MQGARAILTSTPQHYVHRLAAIREAYSRQRVALLKKISVAVHAAASSAGNACAHQGPSLMHAMKNIC